MIYWIPSKQNSHVIIATDDEQKEKDNDFRQKFKLPKGEYALACMFYSSVFIYLFIFI